MDYLRVLFRRNLKRHGQEPAPRRTRTPIKSDECRLPDSPYPSFSAADGQVLLQDGVKHSLRSCFTKRDHYGFFHSDPFGLYEQFHRISQVFTPELVQFQLDEIQVHFRTTLDFAIYAFPRK